MTEFLYSEQLRRRAQKSIAGGASLVNKARRRPCKQVMLKTPAMLHHGRLAYTRLFAFKIFDDFN